MNQNQHTEIVTALVEFVKRAAKENATPGEVAALPEVAKVLLINTPI